jgi:thiazole/oxazole-forming peptide maturase SagD family component
MPLQMLSWATASQQGEGGSALHHWISTGTASHVSQEKAMINAICEFVQIDALMVNWYTKRKSDRVTVDDLTLVNSIPQLRDPSNGFEVRIHDLRVIKDIDLHVFGCSIINKKDDRPLIVYGAQGELNPLKGANRAIMEATAISFLGFYGPLYSPAEYFGKPEGDMFDDLDKNVSFYVHPNDAALNASSSKKLSSGKNRLLSSYPSYCSGDDAKELSALMAGIKRISEHAVYLDITTAGGHFPGLVRYEGLHSRALHHVHAGIPYSQHPRFKEFGGISNGYPHPLP